MEDLRNRNRIQKVDNISKLINFISKIKKNWFKILVFSIIISLILFPTFTGGVIGTWVNTLVSSFLSNISF